MHKINLLNFPLECNVLQTACDGKRSTVVTFWDPYHIILLKSGMFNRVNYLTLDKRPIVLKHGEDTVFYYWIVTLPQPYFRIYEVVQWIF